VQQWFYNQQNPDMSNEFVSFPKDSDEGAYHSELLGFWTLSIGPYSEN
jgi:hypothetical protein